MCTVILKYTRSQGEEWEFWKFSVLSCSWLFRSGSEGQGALVCCSPRVHKESDPTEQLNNNRNTTGHASFQIRLFFFLIPTPRNGIAWSSSNSILSFLSSLHFYLPQCLYQFIFPSAMYRVPFPPHPCQQLLPVFFWMGAILTGICQNEVISHGGFDLHVPDD